jgi:hypothetical protein
LYTYTHAHININTPVHGVEVTLLLLLIFKVDFLATLGYTARHSTAAAAQGGSCQHNA